IGFPKHEGTQIGRELRGAEQARGHTGAVIFIEWFERDLHEPLAIVTPDELQKSCHRRVGLIAAGHRDEQRRGLDEREDVREELTRRRVGPMPVLEYQGSWQFGGQAEQIRARRGKEARSHGVGIDVADAFIHCDATGVASKSSERWEQIFSFIRKQLAHARLELLPALSLRVAVVDPGVLTQDLDERPVARDPPAGGRATLPKQHRRCASARRASAMSRDLPTPASPMTKTTWPEPFAT